MVVYGPVYDAPVRGSEASLQQGRPAHDASLRTSLRVIAVIQAVLTVKLNVFVGSVIFAIPLAFSAVQGGAQAVELFLTALLAIAAPILALLYARRAPRRGRLWSVTVALEVALFFMSAVTYASGLGNHPLGASSPPPCTLGSGSGSLLCETAETMSSGSSFAAIPGGYVFAMASSVAALTIMVARRWHRRAPEQR